MKKKDVFELGEERWGKWLRNHYTTIGIISIPVTLWIILSIAVVIIFGLIGASHFESVVDDQFESGHMTLENYRIITDIFIPIIVQMFDTLEYLMMLIGLSYFVIMFYFMIRRSYRWRKDNL